MVVSSSKIIIIDGSVALALGYYANFKMSFSGAANGHQNWNIMRLAHVISHWKGKLMMINCYKRSAPL